MTAQQIRALGFEWPGNESLDQYAVEHGGNIDLEATLEALRKGLGVYQRQLDGMAQFKARYNPDSSDIDDSGDAALKAADLQQAISIVEQIRKRAGA